MMDFQIDDYAVGFSEALEFKAAEIGSDGSFTGYGAVFGNLDHHADVISKGAFAANVAAHKDRPVALLWHHNQARPIGTVKSLAEDGTGLLVHGKFSLSTSEGRNAYGHAKEGSARGLSIGYQVPPGGAERGKGGVRILNRLDVHEISLTPLPANPLARITGVKTMLSSSGDIARVLQQGGVASRMAHKMAALAIKAVPGAADDDDEDELETKYLDRVAAILRKQARELKGFK
jgi:Escherichia/Staphylococcus phage prohead protease